MQHAFVRCAVAAAVCLVASGCGVKLRVEHTGPLAPAALDGEWVGSWQPATADEDGGGALILRLQQFQGQPVVAVQIDNPCLVPRQYELLLRSTTVELLADGQVVFGAVLGEDRTLLGTYQCEADTGSWTASWQRALPAIVDLSGSWGGTLSVPGATPFGLELDLQQSVRDGVLVLDGTVLVPEVAPLPIPVTGSAQFRAGSFELLLQAATGAPLQFLVSGIGDLEPVRLQSGLVQFFGPTPLPFSQGIVSIVRQTPP